jgi:CheY-like chemotaxis protein
MPSTARVSLKILLVEDEFLIAEEITAMLQDAGHVVLGPAGSVSAAEVVLAGGSTPDVAVIDANLRGQTSAPLVAHLRQRDIPFCVCTGYRMTDLKTLFGDVVTIQKPIDPARLLRTVAMLASKDGG